MAKEGRLANIRKDAHLYHTRDQLDLFQEVVRIPHEGLRKDGVDAQVAVICHNGAGLGYGHAELDICTAQAFQSLDDARCAANGAASTGTPFFQLSPSTCDILR